MTRRINDAGLAVIKRFEGCKLSAYQDVADVWTIGYGHIAGVSAGMTITQAQAEQFLRDDIAATENAVDAATGDARTTDNQFSAMAVLAFNIGAGSFKTSSLLKDHRAGNYEQAADDFLKWDKAHVNGQLQVVNGLLNRRRAERELYLTP